MNTAGPPPHGDRPVVHAGSPLEHARAAVVLLHGRGGSPEDMLGLARATGARLGPDPPAIAWFAPRAAGASWYPESFLAPIERNEPGLSSALAVVGGLVDHAAGAGVPHERVVLAGFSQGACLALEFAFRNPRRYGGVAGLSGGLIGPPGMSWEPGASGASLDGTPVFLGCSDVDPHIPRERVDETAVVMEAMDADVDERIYPGMAHTVNDDEIDAVAALIGRAAS